MWEYLLVTTVHSDKYNETARKHQSDGWTLHSSERRIYRAPGGQMQGPRDVICWDLIFRKAGGQSLPELHMNAAYDKLREVSDALAPMSDPRYNLNHEAIGHLKVDIDAFIFKGSSSDM